MKVVLDTNVLVSGLLSAAGPPGQILELLIDGVLQPCIDGRMLDEYESVLHRPELSIDPENAEEILEFIRFGAETIAALPLPIRLPDPDDLAFLEVAATAQAVLVTGNKRHFPHKVCKNVTILTPREFLDLVSRSG